MQVSVPSSRLLASLSLLSPLVIAQVPVAKVTVKLGPDSTAGTSRDALKKPSEQYLQGQWKGAAAACTIQSLYTIVVRQKNGHQASLRRGEVLKSCLSSLEVHDFWTDVQALH